MGKVETGVVGRWGRSVPGFERTELKCGQGRHENVQLRVGCCRDRTNIFADPIMMEKNCIAKTPSTAIVTSLDLKETVVSASDSIGIHATWFGKYGQTDKRFPISYGHYTFKIKYV